MMQMSVFMNFPNTFYIGEFMMSTGTKLQESTYILEIGTATLIQQMRQTMHPAGSAQAQDGSGGFQSSLHPRSCHPNVRPVGYREPHRQTLGPTACSPLLYPLTDKHNYSSHGKPTLHDGYVNAHHDLLQQASRQGLLYTANALPERLDSYQQLLE